MAQEDERRCAGRPELDRDERFRMLFEHAITGIVMVAPDRRISAANPAFCTMLGYAERELEGLDFESLTHPDDADHSAALFASLMSGELPVLRMEKRYLTSEGATVCAELAVTVIRDDGGRPLHTVATIDDVTARKDAEAQLRRSQSLLRVAGNLARVGGWAIDLPDREVDWTDEMSDILEADQGSTDGSDADDLETGLALYPPRDRARVTAAIEACAADGTPFDMQVQMRTFGGRTIWARLVAEAERGPDGAVSRVVGAFQDITEQRRAVVEALRTTEQLATTLESITDAFYTLDRNWRFTYVNHQAETVLQRTRDELLGANVWEAFPEAVGTAVHDAFHRVMDEGRTEVIDEYFFPPLDTWFTVRAYPSPLGVAVYFQDIGERRRLEHQLRRAQRMESIGTLAGGLAHDLNNVLTPILMSTDLLRSDVEDGWRRELLDGIAASTTRGADIVRQILAFARGTEGRRMAVDVEALLDDVHRIARDTFLKSIEVVREGPDTSAVVLGDPTQLHQVLLNLCVNARDAMPEGGTIRLGVDTVLVDEDYLLVTDEVTPGRYVRLHVEDDGVGMTPETMDRVFEPFFTTKPEGQGTGLGLPVSQGIVTSHGGFLRVHSGHGAGSRFVVHLPLAEDLPDAAEDGDVTDARAGEDELVLLVDDEAQIRSVLANVLEANGFRVLQVGDGASAIAELARHAEEVAVVITDLMMPGLDGVETIRALRRIRPDVPIIAASGLHSRSSVVEEADLEVHRFLAKPFTIDEVLDALQSALARGRAAR